jgi:drug/metabolite transporter (DMT)-like permease
MVKQNFSSWALFITLAIVWGSSFILMKEAALSLTGWQIGSIRITAAGIVLLPLAIFHFRKIPLRKLPLVILSGTLGNLFPAFLFAIAIDKKINSSLAGILNSLTPLFVVIVGLLFFGMKVHQKKILGVVIGFIGLVLLSFTRGTVTIDNYGFTLLILLATVLYGFNVNLVGRYLKEINPLMIATVSMVFISIPAVIVLSQQEVVSLIRYDHEARLAIGMVALLGIVGTAFATAIFYQLIQKAGGLFASLVTYAIPVVAIFWGVLAGENVTLMQIGCLSLILGGVYLANRE